MGNEMLSEQDPTVGLNALVPEMPSFEIEGVKYRMTRLGLTHAMMALRIFAAASGGIMKMSALNNVQSNPATIALAILSALPYAENHVKDLVASTVARKKGDKWEKISKFELDDADLFPLESIILIVEALGVHPDLKAFLKNIGRLQQSPLWEEIQNRVGPSEDESETSSNDN